MAAERAMDSTTKRGRRLGLSAAALALAALLAAPGAALADNAMRFDGTWSVRTSAETGSCGKNYDFKLNVKGGKVTYAGYWPVNAAGGISKVGIVKMTLSHNGGKVVATGLAAGDQASGDWSSPEPNCSGSWFAKRA